MKSSTAIGLLSLLSVGAALFAVSVGPGDLHFRDLFSAAASSETAHAILWELRIPRVLLSFVIGAALSAGGVVSQGLFRNPLADPSVLGVSMGSAAFCGHRLCLEFGSPWSMGHSPIGNRRSRATLFVLFALAGQSRDIATLLLSGVALSSMSAALITVLLAVHIERWDLGIKVMTWLMGSFEGRSWLHLVSALIPISLGFALSFAARRDLDVLHLGDETAASLGVNLKTMRSITVTSIAILVGTATALVGVIGFVGLVIPHVARMIAGPKHAILLPLSILLAVSPF